MDLKLEIRKAFDELEPEMRRALRTLGAGRVVAYVDQRMKRRTLKGEYLEGSSPNPERYRSTQYRRKREKRGLQVDRVDLYVRGAMLAATRGRTSVDQAGVVTIEVGYIEGESPSDEMKIAEYHNKLGAGTSKVLRKFVGLTPHEKDVALEMIRRGFYNSFS